MVKRARKGAGKTRSWNPRMLQVEMKRKGWVLANLEEGVGKKKVGWLDEEGTSRRPIV
jgi:hypothetical protein